ncbi:TPA: hypothetical protein WIV77_001623 [Neisseria meningitidis]
MMMHASVQSRFAPILYVLIFFAGFLTAQIWFNQKAYTEELPPLLSALSAVALVWLAWAFVSARSKAKAEKFYREKMIQNESIHPVLHASLQHLEHKPQMLALLVKNHGKGMAEQVRFKAEVLPDDEDARTIAAELAKMDMFALGTDAVASGETYGRVFADIFELSAALEGREFKGMLKLTAEYKNIFGDACRSETALDLGALNQALQEISKTSEKSKRIFY